MENKNTHKIAIDISECKAVPCHDNLGKVIRYMVFITINPSAKLQILFDKEPTTLEVVDEIHKVLNIS